LARLDERVEAHLAGLRLAGDVAWLLCKENLANGEGSGELFALAVLAFCEGNRQRMAEVLNAADESPARLRGLESALGWIDYRTVSKWIERLVLARAPRHRVIGLAATANHLEDPGSLLAEALEDSDPALRVRALRIAGELKRHDLLDSILAHTSDDDESCRFWAAWSSTLLGQQGLVDTLVKFAEKDRRFTTAALAVALRAMDPAQSRYVISSFAKEPTLIRWAILGAGIHGDPISIPWLIRRMESPEHARVAGESLTMITGVDLGLLHLDVPPASEEQEESLSLDYDSNLPCPSAELVDDWWRKNQASWQPNMRYLAGKPIGKDSAIDVLRQGKQRQRAGAAIELALIEPRALLFNVRGRGFWQYQKLATLT